MNIAALHINMKEICFSLHTFLDFFQIKVFKTFFEITYTNQWRRWFLMNINETQMS